MKLTKVESQILKSKKAGEYRAVSKAEKNRLESIFKTAARKVTRINIRLSDDDILKLKTKAKREGVPYQTLIGSVLHKFLEGILIDIDEVQKIKKLLR